MGCGLQLLFPFMNFWIASSFFDSVIISLTVAFGKYVGWLVWQCGHVEVIFRSSFSFMVSYILSRGFRLKLCS